MGSGTRQHRRHSGGEGLAVVLAATTVKWSAELDKVVLPMVISPVVGLLLGYLVMTAVWWRQRALTRVWSIGLHMHHWCENLADEVLQADDVVAPAGVLTC